MPPDPGLFTVVVEVLTVGVPELDVVVGVPLVEGPVVVVVAGPADFVVGAPARGVVAVAGGGDAEQ